MTGCSAGAGVEAGVASGAGASGVGVASGAGASAVGVASGVSVGAGAGVAAGVSAVGVGLGAGCGSSDPPQAATRAPAAINRPVFQAVDVMSFNLRLVTNYKNPCIRFANFYEPPLGRVC